MLDAARLKALLAYDPQQGVFTWLDDGRVAGCGTANGYVVVGIGGRLYLAHRLAWLWMTGAWPAAHVDHRNRAKNDNRWENLREATVPQNLANSGPRASSKSGVKGVSWCRSTGKWRATITIDGKQRSLGRHVKLECAEAAYRAAAIRHFGEFAEVANS